MNASETYPEPLILPPTSLPFKIGVHGIEDQCGGWDQKPSRHRGTRSNYL